MRNPAVLCKPPQDVQWPIGEQVGSLMRWCKNRSKCAGSALGRLVECETEWDRLVASSISQQRLVQAGGSSDDEEALSDEESEAQVPCRDIDMEPSVAQNMIYTRNYLVCPVKASNLDPNYNTLGVMNSSAAAGMNQKLVGLWHFLVEENRKSGVTILQTVYHPSEPTKPHCFLLWFFITNETASTKRTMVQLVSPDEKSREKMAKDRKETQRLRREGWANPEVRAALCVPEALEATIMYHERHALIQAEFHKMGSDEVLIGDSSFDPFQIFSVENIGNNMDGHGIRDLDPSEYKHEQSVCFPPFVRPNLQIIPPQTLIAQYFWNTKVWEDRVTKDVVAVQKFINDGADEKKGGRARKRRKVDLISSFAEQFLGGGSDDTEECIIIQIRGDPEQREREIFEKALRRVRAKSARIKDAKLPAAESAANVVKHPILRQGLARELQLARAEARRQLWERAAPLCTPEGAISPEMKAQLDLIAKHNLANKGLFSLQRPRDGNLVRGVVELDKLWLSMEFACKINFRHKEGVMLVVSSCGAMGVDNGARSHAMILGPPDVGKSYLVAQIIRMLFEGVMHMLARESLTASEYAGDKVGSIIVRDEAKGVQTGAGDKKGSDPVQSTKLLLTSGNLKISKTWTDEKGQHHHKMIIIHHFTTTISISNLHRYEFDPTLLNRYLVIMMDKRQVRTKKRTEIHQQTHQAKVMNLVSGIKLVHSLTAVIQQLISCGLVLPVNTTLADIVLPRVKSSFCPWFANSLAGDRVEDRIRSSVRNWRVRWVASFLLHSPLSPLAQIQNGRVEARRTTISDVLKAEPYLFDASLADVVMNVGLQMSIELSFYTRLSVFQRLMNFLVNTALEKQGDKQELPRDFTAELPPEFPYLRPIDFEFLGTNDRPHYLNRTPDDLNYLFSELKLDAEKSRWHALSETSEHDIGVKQFWKQQMLRRREYQREMLTYQRVLRDYMRQFEMEYNGSIVYCFKLMSGRSGEWETLTRLGKLLPKQPHDGTAFEIRSFATASNKPPPQWHQPLLASIFYEQPKQHDLPIGGLNSILKIERLEGHVCVLVDPSAVMLFHRNYLPEAMCEAVENRNTNPVITTLCEPGTDGRFKRFAILPRERDTVSVGERSEMTRLDIEELELAVGDDDDEMEDVTSLMEIDGRNAISKDLAEVAWEAYLDERHILRPEADANNILPEPAFSQRESLVYKRHLQATRSLTEKDAASKIFKHSMSNRR